ncbi:hypothetical protein [Pontibacter flavimaris]|uniref:Uncharacterized protein n=1 Tax=Pontibacter flavimaris TaxID=1797110 RepID=A0A1Q5PGW9_9BACT|nr:hypothetical protein [Pontibacter flavimaris]OKL41382.1 hypothetical protein A3841_09990 [Pontibacter flavimaris]
MKKRTKIILSLSVGLVLLFCGFIYLSFHTMEIEDHYGDLQQFYYQSKDEDIILNHDNKKFGIIEKDTRRIRIVDTRNEKVDLYNWVYIYDDFQESKIEVFRPDSKIDLARMNYEEVVSLIQKNEMELIIKN